MNSYFHSLIFTTAIPPYSPVQFLGGIIYLKANPEFLKLISRSVESVPTKEPIAINFDEIVEQAPEPGNQTQEYSRKKRSYQARKYDLVKKEAENKKLGKLGEEFAVKFEQDRLIKAGRVDLANKVERISETKGDGAGYDVLSFEADGSERFIEVKTTNFGKSYPFNITANELDFSEDSSGHYYLYRVFKFKDSPKLFILEGSLKDKFNLIPTVYKLSF